MSDARLAFLHIFSVSMMGPAESEDTRSERLGIFAQICTIREPVFGEVWTNAMLRWTHRLKQKREKHACYSLRLSHAQQLSCSKQRQEGVGPRSRCSANLLLPGDCHTLREATEQSVNNGKSPVDGPVGLQGSINAVEQKRRQSIQWRPLFLSRACLCKARTLQLSSL